MLIYKYCDPASPCIGTSFVNIQRGSFLTMDSSEWDCTVGSIYVVQFSIYLYYHAHMQNDIQP